MADYDELFDDDYGYSEHNQTEQDDLGNDYVNNDSVQ
jgi:hypothetical protein